MKKSVASILSFYLILQSFPQNLLSKPQGISFYRVFFSKNEWKKKYPDIPESLNYLPENIFNFKNFGEFKVLFGAFNDNETTYDKMVENNFFSEDMHDEAVNYLIENDRENIYKNIKNFFNTYSGDKYDKIEFDVKFIARQTFILNHYYFKYDNRPEVLTTLYYAYNLLFKLTCNQDKNEFNSDNRLYQDYLLFKHDRKKYLSGKDYEDKNFSYKVLNYFCYDYINRLNGLILKNDQNNKMALESSLMINRYFQQYKNKLFILERLLKFKPGNLDLKKELLECYYFSGNPKQHKLEKEIKMKYPETEKVIDELKEGVLIAKKLNAWQRKYTKYDKINYKKKWYETVELLIKNKRLNELNNFFNQATQDLKKEKRYKLLMLDYAGLLGGDIFTQNLFGKILNPDLFFQEIIKKSRYIIFYYNYTFNLVNKYPAEKKIFKHVIVSSLHMCMIDLIKKGIELKKTALFSNAKVNELDMKAIFEIVAITKKRWQMMEQGLQILRKDKYQQQVCESIHKIGTIFFKHLESRRFWNVLTDSKLTLNEILIPIWDDLKIITEEIGEIVLKIDFENSHSKFLKFSFENINKFLNKKDSLKLFIQTINFYEDKFANADDSYAYVFLGCDILLKINQSVLKKFNNYPGLGYKEKNKNRKQILEINQFAMVIQEVIRYLQQHKGDQNKKFWKRQIPYALYNKIIKVKKRYLYEKYLENFFKAQFLLAVYKENRKKKYIKAAYYYLDQVFTQFKNRESNNERKARNIILFQENNDILENCIYQNTGFCLNYFNNNNAKYFISLASKKNNDQDLNITYFLEQHYALNYGDNKKMLKIYEETYNDLEDNDKLDKKTRDIYKKSVLKNILKIMKTDKGKNRIDIEKYEKMLKPLENIKDIKAGFMSFGGGADTESGLSFFINLYKYYFMVKL